MPTHIGTAHTTYSRETVHSCIQMQEQIQMWGELKTQKAAHKYTHTHTSTQINPISHPDGVRVAADVAGRAVALLAQVTCSQQLAQVRHSWELEPQGKCSCWLRGWRCVWQAGTPPQVHRHCTQNGLIQRRKKKRSEYCHTHTEIMKRRGLREQKKLLIGVCVFMRARFVLVSLLCVEGY